jgi:hypothetical protein
MKWFVKEVVDGENSILVYPNLQTFRLIYAKYVKNELLATRETGEDNNNNYTHNNKQSKSRIILIAPFYETTECKASSQRF